MRRNGTHGRLTPEMIRAAQALAHGDTDAEAAKAAGVGRSTIYRWMQRADFSAARNYFNDHYAREYWAERKRRASELLVMAFDALEAAMSVDAPLDLRAKIALTVFDKFDKAPSPNNGPIDPAEVEAGWNRLETDPVWALMREQTIQGRPASPASLDFMAQISEIEASIEGTGR